MISGIVTLSLLLAPLQSAATVADPKPAPTPPSQVKQADFPDLRVTILGSGNPVPRRDQVGTTILVQTATQNLLFDCGRGCTTRLAQVDPALIPKVDKLFLTHLHSDHIVGIPDLWLNGWTQGRSTPLRIWGPKGTIDMMKGLRAAYSADIDYRLADGIPANDKALAQAITPLDGGGVVYRANGLTVTAFRVKHGRTVPAYGYRIDTGKVSLIISGDTTATPALVKYGKGADVALMEVASPAMVGYVEHHFTPEQAKDVLGLHMTVQQAGQELAGMRPRLAVYYHNVSTKAADAALLSATKKLFKGRTIVSHDLTRIDIRPGKIEVIDPTQNPAP